MSVVSLRVASGTTEGGMAHVMPTSRHNVGLSNIRLVGVREMAARYRLRISQADDRVSVLTDRGNGTDSSVGVGRVESRSALPPPVPVCVHVRMRNW